MLYVAVLDSVVTNTTVETLQDGYETYMSLDEETQETLFDNSIMISNTSDAASAQKFTVHAYVADIDVLIASESVLKQYAESYIRPLSEQLPADLYDMLTDRFCYAEPVDEQGNPGKSQPYGIYISDLVDKSPYCKEPIALAICGNTKREKNAEEFVRYLLEQAEGMQGIATE